MTRTRYVFPANEAAKPAECGSNSFLSLKTGGSCDIVAILSRCDSRTTFVQNLTVFLRTK